MKRISLIERTDSYKFGQAEFYPTGIGRSHAYICARGGMAGHTLFFGLQYILMEYLTDPVTKEDVEKAARKTKAHGTSFNYSGWMKIVEKYNGFLPITIRAMPEGTLVPVKVPCVLLECNDPEFFWTIQYIEGLIQKVWYPSTVATTSLTCRNIIKEYMEKSCDNLDGLPWKLHDFGYRGGSSEETSAIGGAAHLIVGRGSDTFTSNNFLEEYYGAEEISSGSIDATEHSNMTSWGGPDFEYTSYENFVDKCIARGIKIAACVSDSFNIYESPDKWAKLQPKIDAAGLTIVVRPDSGDPVATPIKVMELLAEKCGFSYNKRGYKVLNNFRVIQGDGMVTEEIRKLYAACVANGFSADNLTVGMGGGLIQKCDRDTQRWNQKLSALICNGKFVPVFKRPIGDPGKNSMQGFLDVERDVKGNFVTVSSEYPGESIGTCMVKVFDHGKITKKWTLQDIRERVDAL